MGCGVGEVGGVCVNILCVIPAFPVPVESSTILIGSPEVVESLETQEIVVIFCK